MRNINKIKEIENDKYIFSLDNKQVMAIIISSLFLGGVLFFTGYFIGKEGYNKKNINNEIKTKNIAIISTGVKEVAVQKHIEDKKEVAVQKHIEDKKEVAIQKHIEDKKEVAIQKHIEDKKEVDSKSIIEKGEGTGDKPFKTTLKSGKSGKYLLQVLASPKFEEANELKNRLIESGYNSFIEKVDSNGVTYNRVRIGFFKSSQEARVFKNSFEKESGIKKTFITVKK